MLERYDALSDYLKAEEVAEKITEFLTEVQTANVDVEDASAALCELAEIGQWHTYEYLETTLKTQVDNWVTVTWNNLDLRATHGLPDWLVNERARIVEELTSAIGMFGLSQSYRIVKDSLSRDMHPVIRTEIEGTITEYGDVVDDPYKGLKNLKDTDEHFGQ